MGRQYLVMFFFAVFSPSTTAHVFFILVPSNITTPAFLKCQKWNLTARNGNISLAICLSGHRSSYPFGWLVIDKPQMATVVSQYDFFSASSLCRINTPTNLPVIPSIILSIHSFIHPSVRLSINLISDSPLPPSFYPSICH